jgi:hypothetical protein
MPAHIGIYDVMRGAFHFSTQFGVVSQGGWGYRNMHKTETGQSLGAGKHGASPAVVARVLERTRSRREVPCTDYDTYRDAMDRFRPTSLYGSDAWLNLRGQPKNLRSAHDRMQRKVESGADKADFYDGKGFDNFTVDWHQNLAPGTRFDGLMAKCFKEGWTITLIKGKGVRQEQLKRIEGKKRGEWQIIIFWTAD